MDYLPFGKLSLYEKFLPAEEIKKIDINYFLFLQKSYCLTKIKAQTITNNGTSIKVNAEFNMTGNKVFVKDDELVIPLL